MKGEHTEQSPKAERRLPLVRIRLDEARSRTRDERESIDIWAVQWDGIELALRSSSWQQTSNHFFLFIQLLYDLFFLVGWLALDYLWVPNDPWSRIQRNQREKALILEW